MSSTPVKSGTPTAHHTSRIATSWLLVILEELTKSLLDSFFEASDAIFCIPMIKAAVAREHTMNEFASNVGRHRRELLIHCCRMLGSLPDAQDAVHETLLRA